MSHIRAFRELIAPDDHERRAYEELSDALVYPNPRLIAEDGSIVTIPPAAAGVLSELAALIAAGRDVQITLSDEAGAVRTRYHIDVLTRMSEEMGGYDPVEAKPDAADG